MSPAGWRKQGGSAEDCFVILWSLFSRYTSSPCPLTPQGASGVLSTLVVPNFPPLHPTVPVAITEFEMAPLRVANVLL